MNLGHFGIIVLVLRLAVFVWKVRDDNAYAKRWEHQCEVVMGGEAFTIPDRADLCLMPDGTFKRIEGVTR